MRIYLAARYSRLAVSCRATPTNCALGHDGRARWLLGPPDTRSGWTKLRPNTAPFPIELFAEDDFYDVFEADSAFSEEPRTGGASRCGRHVELGLALALAKRDHRANAIERTWVPLTLSQVSHF